MDSFVNAFSRNIQYLRVAYRWFRYYLLSLYGKRQIRKSPEEFVRRFFWHNFAKPINLENPITFNEKINWLKLFWLDQRAVVCSDKYRVRDYVRQKGLGHILNELCADGVYSSPVDIDLRQLPEKFVLKATHASDFNLICTDKSAVDWRLWRMIMCWWLRIQYEYMAGEWPYRTDAPRIICEKYLENSDGSELIDYKFFCFDGKPELIFLASNRKKHVKSDFYDVQWRKQPFRWIYEPSGRDFPKPKCLEEMVAYARCLSESFPYSRIDFYEVDGKVYFGEITFFHGAGKGWFHPECIDSELGAKLRLPVKSTPWGQT